MTARVSSVPVQKLRHLELMLQDPWDVMIAPALGDLRQSIYDVAGAVSDQDLQSMMKLAADLQSKLQTWLRKEHPELLKG